MRRARGKAGAAVVVGLGWRLSQVATLLSRLRRAAPRPTPLPAPQLHRHAQPRPQSRAAVKMVGAARLSVPVFVRFVRKSGVFLPFHRCRATAHPAPAPLCSRLHCAGRCSRRGRGFEPPCPGPHRGAGGCGDGRRQRRRRWQFKRGATLGLGCPQRCPGCRLSPARCPHPRNVHAPGD